LDGLVLAALAAWLTRTPRLTVLVDALPMRVPRLTRWWLRPWLRWADRILVTDDDVRRRLVEEGWVPEGAIVPLRLGGWEAGDLAAAAGRPARWRAGQVAGGTAVGTADAEESSAPERWADPDDHLDDGLPAWLTHPIGHHGVSYSTWAQLAAVWRGLMLTDTAPCAPTRWERRDGRGAFSRAEAGRP
jgi:hypothetical protein